MHWRNSSCFDIFSEHLSMCISLCADLIVKLAKDKFGAIQTEYQKVSAWVCVQDEIID